MRVLVTGGLGFIGSHTIVELIEAGHEIVILDNCSNSKMDVLESIESVVGAEKRANGIRFHLVDITKEDELEELLGGIGIVDTIIHFAALKNVGESNDKPDEYYYNNLVGLLNILRFAKKIGCPNFIFSSSATVYSRAAILPYREADGGAGALRGRYDTMRTGDHPYGSTKIICEQILHDIAAAGWWNILVLRYFNPVGAHPSGALGEEYKPGKVNNLFPAVLGAVHEGRDLMIFGDNYETVDGTPARDYIHVVDLADAHVKGLNFLAKRESGLDCINVGLGRGVTVKEVLEIFLQKGFPVKWLVGPRRAGGMPASYCDNKRALEWLGWVPKYSLEDMVEHTMQFYNKNNVISDKN